MINFYELYKLFLITGNGYYLFDFFCLTIICFFSVFIFFAIFIFKKNKKEFQGIKQKISFFALLLFLTSSVLFFIFGNIGYRMKAEKQIKDFKKIYELKIDKKIFLKQAKKLEKFCKNYRKNKKHLEVEDYNFCNSNSNALIDVDPFTFNQIFNEVYKNDFNKLKAEKEIKEKINYIIKEE